MSLAGPSIKTGQLLELEIRTLGYGGQGIARVHDFVIFVKGAMPEDKARVRIIKKKPGFAEAELVELIRASPFRTSPRCSHFGLCGGCKWQNLEYSKQVEYKTEQVREILEHLAGFSDPPVLPALPAGQVYLYRNKMEFSFSTDCSGKLTIGLHLAGKFDEVFDLEACFLQSEVSNRIVHQVRTFCQEKNLSVYDLNRHSGFLRFLVIKEAKNTGEIMVNFVTHQGDASLLKELAEELVKEYPAIKTVARNINTKKAQIAVGEKEELLAGRPYITEKLGPFSFQISANSFFQSNSLQAEKLCTLSVDFVAPHAEDTVLDLYSGTGTISFYLAQKAGAVLGIESNPLTVEDAKKNARLNNINNCQFICSEAKDYLALAMVRKEGFDAVVVDPPRFGLHPKVVENLVKLGPAKIVYVSCNPATLARDLKILCEKDYRLDQVQPVDMFPHTFHIETVSKLVKKE